MKEKGHQMNQMKAGRISITEYRAIGYANDVLAIKTSWLQSCVMIFITTMRNDGRSQHCARLHLKWTERVRTDCRRVTSSRFEGW